MPCFSATTFPVPAAVESQLLTPTLSFLSKASSLVTALSWEPLGERNHLHDKNSRNLRPWVGNALKQLKAHRTSTQQEPLWARRPPGWAKEPGPPPLPLPCTRAPPAPVSVVHTQGRGLRGGHRCFSANSPPSSSMSQGSNTTDRKTNNPRARMTLTEAARSFPEVLVRSLR